MVMHIGSQPTPPIKPKQDTEELENKLDEAERRILTLTWMNNLSDEKTFRLELLQAIERMTESINNLTTKVVEITSGK